MQARQAVIVSLLSLSFALPALAGPLGAATPLSPATQLTPNQTEQVVLDTKKLENGVNYYISCPIHNISQPDGSGDVYAYFKGEGFGATESLSLTGSGISQALNVTNGYTTKLKADGSYALTGMNVQKTLDLAHSIRIGDIDGKGSFTVEPCLATPALGSSNYALGINPASIVLYQEGAGQTLTVTNIGNIAVSDISLGNVPDGVSVSGCNSPLAVGESCTLNLNAASSAQIGGSLLQLTAGNLPHPIGISLEVSGNQPPPATTLSVSPDAVLVQKGQSETVTLTNTGDHVLMGAPIINQGSLSSSDVQVLADISCTDLSNLAPNNTCPITITAASNSQDYNAVPVSIAAANVSSSINLGVSVGQAALVLDNNAFSMESRSDLNIEIHNNTPFTVNDVTITGSNGSQLPAGLSESSACTLAPQGSCSITLTASDALSGAFNLEASGDNTANNPGFSLQVAKVGISLVNPGNMIYVPSNGTLALPIQNNSTGNSARELSMTGLPAGVSADTCTAAPQATCNLSITSSNADVTGPVSIAIAGSNTTTLQSQLSVESPGITVSPAPLSFNGPGSQLITVSNNSHFTLSNIVPNVNNLSDVSITNNTCSSLAGEDSTNSPNSCTFKLTAAATASSNTGGYLAVNGNILGNPVTSYIDVTLTEPTISINHNAPIVLPSTAGSATAIPIEVSAGGFALNNPTVQLILNNQVVPSSQATVSLVDANNANNPCPNPLPAGGVCNSVISNIQALDPSDPNGDGQLELSGSNLSAPVTQSVDVSGGVAISDIGVNDPNYSTYYQPLIQGPRYGVIAVQSLESSSEPLITINNVSWTQADGSISIVPRGANTFDPIYGNYSECVSGATLVAGATCLIVTKALPADPSLAARLAQLQVDAGNSVISATHTYTFTNSTYLYAVGDFTAMGNATANGPFIAQCTAGGACTNALSAPNNYADSIIIGLSSDPAGNLYVGGSFNSIGGASVGTPGYQYLLAKCSNGSCSNGLTGANNNYANATIYTLSSDDTTDNLYVGGNFNSIGGASVSQGQTLLAKCSNGSCSNALAGTNNNADSTIIALSTDDTTGNLYVGGFFNSIGGASVVGTLGNKFLLAKCSNGSCSNALTDPNNNYASAYIFALSNDDTTGNLYVGGDFNSIGGASVGTPGNQYLLAKCSNGSCTNALSGLYNYANGDIFRVVLSNTLAITE